MGAMFLTVHVTLKIEVRTPAQREVKVFFDAVQAAIYAASVHLAAVLRSHSAAKSGFTGRASCYGWLFGFCWRQEAAGNSIAGSRKEAAEATNPPPYNQRKAGADILGSQLDAK